MTYLEGRLRENTVGSEGEHTGYVLEIEVDVSAVTNLEELADEQVAVTGDVEFAEYPERGKILVFKATSAAAIEEELEEVG
jgi:chemotaxis protein CheY-P-specific phosphatase CheC